MYYDLDQEIGKYHGENHEKKITSLLNQVAIYHNDWFNRSFGRGDYRSYTLVQTAVVCHDLITLTKLIEEHNAIINVNPTSDTYFLPMAIIGRELPNNSSYHDETTKIIINMAKLLVKHHADPNVPTHTYTQDYNAIIPNKHICTTPLGCACIRNNYELAEILLRDAHADPNLFFGHLDNCWISLPPLNIAEKYSDRNIIVLLETYGARKTSKLQNLEQLQIKLPLLLMYYIYRKCNDTPINLLDDFLIENIAEYYIESIFESPILIHDGHFDNYSKLYV